jgi:eukaryotic-like serine/threonine-protein kinase
VKHDPTPVEWRAVPRTEKILAPERQAELFDLLGTTVGSKYRLERLVGTGGSGAVFAAKVLAGGDPVAVKVLSVTDPAIRERIAKRFAREARASKDIRCAHIVTVLDAGTEDARPWLVMELLEGEDLGRRIQRVERLPVKDTLHLAAQVLVALSSAHEAGIVHRDLKPDNVFVTTQGDDPLYCKLLDFGMSKLLPGEGQTLALALTKQGMAVGTPFYMAPEQARASADVDGRADVWALGAIMFECITGRPPFVAATQEQMLIAICTTDAPDVRAMRPEVPSPVAKLVKRALQRDRTLRFGSAKDMLVALAEVAPEEAKFLPPKPLASTLPLGPISVSDTSGPITAPPTPRSHSGSHVVRPRSSSTLHIVAFALCAVLLGVGVMIYALAMTRHR